MKKTFIGILVVIAIGAIAVFALNYTGTDLSVSGKKSGVSVELADGVSDYPVDIATISYKVVNETEQSVRVVLIPKLERNFGLQFEEKWEQVDLSDGVSFCGTADTIERKNTQSGTIEMDWFKNLVIGKYRLTFEGQDGIVVAPTEFMLHKGKADL